MAKPTRKTPPSLTNLPSIKNTGGELEGWIESLPANYMGCRDFGHVWRATTARWDPEHRSFNRSQKCQRCKTIRTQDIGSEGTIGSTQYTYDQGYKAPSGAGRWDKDARAMLRLASTLRMIASDD